MKSNITDDRKDGYLVPRGTVSDRCRETRARVETARPTHCPLWSRHNRPDWDRTAASRCWQTWGSRASSIEIVRQLRRSRPLTTVTMSWCWASLVRSGSIGCRPREDSMSMRNDGCRGHSRSQSLLSRLAFFLLWPFLFDAENEPIDMPLWHNEPSLLGSEN